MILLKQQRERETKATRCQSEVDIINIWMKVINTITAAIVNFDNKTDAFEGEKLTWIIIACKFSSFPMFDYEARYGES